MLSQALLVPRLRRRLPLRDAWVWAVADEVDRAVWIARALETVVALSAALPRETAALDSCGRAVAGFGTTLLRAGAWVHLAHELLPSASRRPLVDTLQRAGTPASTVLSARARWSALAPLTVPVPLRAMQHTELARLGARAEPAPGMLGETLRAAGLAAAEVPEQFLDALPPRVEWIHVERGLRWQYRQLRRAWRRARRQRPLWAWRAARAGGTAATWADPALERLRRRATRLRDQLGLLLPEDAVHAPRVRRAHARLMALSHALESASALAALCDPATAVAEGDPLQHALAACLTPHARRQRSTALAMAARSLTRAPRAAASRWLDELAP